MTMIDHYIMDHFSRIYNSDATYCPVNYFEIRKSDGGLPFNSNWLQWENSTYPTARVRAWSSDPYTETVRIYAYTRSYLREADQENMYTL
jgi:hypothetical protein